MNFKILKPTLKKEFVLVFIIMLFALFLRLYKIDTDLLYHRDQGLVAMDIYKIWHDKKISLLGAPTDVDGLNHSPLYYWVIAPFYMLGRGDLVYPAVVQILFEVSTLPFLYLVIKKIFNKQTAFLTLIFYSVSYGLISYSRWFISVPLILPLANIFLYTLVFKKGVLINSLLVGIIAQIHAAVGVFYLPFLFFHFKKSLSFKNIFLIILGFLIPAFPLIVFQFRHDFITAKVFLNFAFNSSAGTGFSLDVFWNNLVILLRQITNLVLFPYLLPSTILFVYALLRVKKDSKYKILIYSYFLIPFLFLGIFQRGAISFFFIAALPLALSVLTYGIINSPKFIKVALILVIVFLNLNLLKNIYEPNNALIPIGDRNVITLGDRKAVIDWMYQKAEGKDFSVWIYTIPYFQDYPWQYLFITYAKDKYGYLPEKTASFSPNDLKTSKHFFNIYEIDHDTPSRQSAWFEEVFKNFGESVDYFSSNDIHVEMRGL